jgi:hypothetical protein
MFDVDVTLPEVRRVLIDEFKLNDAELLELTNHDDIAQTVFCSIYGYIPEVDDANYIQYKGYITELMGTADDQINYKRAMGVI